MNIGRPSCSVEFHTQVIRHGSDFHYIRIENDDASGCWHCPCDWWLLLLYPLQNEEEDQGEDTERAVKQMGWDYDECQEWAMDQKVILGIENHFEHFQHTLRGK